MTQIGTTFIEQTVSAVAAAAAPTAIGLIGTDEQAAGADHAVAELATPTKVTSATDALTKGGNAGTLFKQLRTIYARAPQATCVFARYNHALAGAALVAAQEQALESLQNAEQVTDGTKPLILVAQDLAYEITSDAPTAAASDIFAALQEIAANLKGIAIADAPYNTTAIAKAWATNNSAARVMAVANQVKIGSNAFEGASATLAGQRALMDGQPNGIRLPLENEPLAGITDVNRRISYQTEGNSDLQQLVGAKLGVIVYDNAAYRLYGGDFNATSPFDDLVARRVVDLVERETGEIGRQYIAARRTGPIVDELTLKFQSYLDDQVSARLIASGTARPDRSYNADEGNQNARRIGFIFELGVPVGIRVIQTTAQISVVRI